MKKLLSLLLVTIMFMSMLPVMAQEPTTVTITFSAYDSVNYQFVFMPQTIKVTAGTAAKYGFLNDSAYIAENQVSAMDAFVAAHEMMYGQDEIQDKWNGLNLANATKMFGTDGSISYMINDEYANDGFSMGYAINQAIINNGDIVSFYSYADQMMISDYYSYFDAKEKTAGVGESFTLSLSAFQATELMWAVPGDPTPESYTTLTKVPQADIISLDPESGAFDKPLAVTDDNGNVTLAFEEPGTYYISAMAMIDGYIPMIAPWCKVTVNAPTEPDTLNKVTVKAAPSSANIKFYTCDGFNENNTDIPGEEITVVDEGVIDNYHTYTMQLEDGRYSYRATDENGSSLGGMTFAVSGDCTITLRQLDVYTTTKYDGTNYATENEYTTTVQDYEEYFATAGTPYKKGNYTRYPYLLCALDNPFPYKIELIPNEAVATQYSLGTNTISGYAVKAGTSIATKSGAIPTLINTIINAPEGAKVQVFKQIKNYLTEEIAYANVEDAENNTINYTYRLPKDNSNHTYRVTMDGKITKAGYLNLKSEPQITVTFEENEDPKVRPAYDKTTPLGKRSEDSIVLNINQQNYLRLNQGEEFTARAYRAVQIINSDTSNIMIEPDFHYNIISGDSVTIEQDGHKADIKAVKEGISIIEVTYDAIEVTGSPNYSGLYGAVDPDRKGLFVVNVGGDTATSISMTDWDSDLDTVYILGETGTFNFAPTSDAEMIVTADDNVINANSDGTYTIPVKQGNNLIIVTAGDTTEYLVVKGDKVTANIVNVTNPDCPVKQGDTLQITFDGLHLPVPKMGGVYNPGYRGTVKIEYTTPDGTTIASTGTQYDFITNHTITVTLAKEGTLKLSGGHITLKSMGFEFGAHRFITDSGLPANFNASEQSGVFSIMPDLEIEVLKGDIASIKEAVLENNTLTMTVTSSEEKDVNIFVGSYSGIALTGSAQTSTHLSVGDNSGITIDCTKLNRNDDIFMFIWDKNMSPLTGKIPLK